MKYFIKILGKAPLQVLYAIIISQDEYDILVITQIQGEAKDEC